MAIDAVAAAAALILSENEYHWGLLAKREMEHGNLVAGVNLGNRMINCITKGGSCKSEGVYQPLRRISMGIRDLGPEVERLAQ